MRTANISQSFQPTIPFIKRNEITLNIKNVITKKVLKNKEMNIIDDRGRKFNQAILKRKLKLFFYFITDQL